jgi:nitrite reductase/ring-hydroxylating ferredoxin subunit
MSLKEQTRRQFCGNTCRAASVAALGAALATILESCGGGGGPTSPGGNLSALPVVTGTAANNTVVVTIDSASPLATAGTAALVKSTIGDLLVARTGQDTFTALSSLCTHQSCEITGWGGNVFVCPCHGSTFDTSGRVVSGPAFAALRQYTTQFASGTLTISA